MRCLFLGAVIRACRPSRVKVFAFGTLVISLVVLGRFESPLDTGGRLC